MAYSVCVQYTSQLDVCTCVCSVQCHLHMYGQLSIPLPAALLQVLIIVYIKIYITSMHMVIYTHMQINDVQSTCIIIIIKCT